MCRYLVFALLGLVGPLAVGQDVRSPEHLPVESRHDYDARMQWWNEARFGMFIHWGLYAVPAGEWGDRTDHAEWIRNTAHIPLETYDRFVEKFDPVDFDATEWVRMAKSAGMKYIVITSKHHDGFCLFDSEQTEFDVMSTPFKRDILGELADAARREGITICWYHSIMDWHHPDYLPRRNWETDRPAEGAEFDRYVRYMKSQVRELLTNYGEIGVLWFDGEWEHTWNTARGLDLYTFVRGLQPDIIVNNRVGAGRSGMQGFTKEGEFAGDYATPEQEVPATGIPGVYWETCMTMNDNWGYNKNDHNWKSSTDLIRHLVDITSKGGNFLLNVGPTAEGRFPEASVERLRDIGLWMSKNGESIYGTAASPFAALPWGRCTRRTIAEKTRLYLHVFEYPTSGQLIVPGIANRPTAAYLLAAESMQVLPVTRREDALVIGVPDGPHDSANTVVVLDIAGTPDITGAPTISATSTIFVDTLTVTLASDRVDRQIRYTLDASSPDQFSALYDHPIEISKSMTITARCFQGTEAAGPTASMQFHKVLPRAPVHPDSILPGLRYAYYEGAWISMPDFATLSPVQEGVVRKVSADPKNREEDFALVFDGYVDIPRDGVYLFTVESDDGSQMSLGGDLIVDNDGLHGMVGKTQAVALAAGLHPIRIAFFQGAGSVGLNVAIAGPGLSKRSLPETMLFYRP